MKVLRPVLTTRPRYRQLGLVLAALTLSLGIGAQEAAMRTSVVTLGTQGGMVHVGQRSQPANAVVVGDRIYVVDAGNGLMRQLALAKLDYRRVNQIFITHNHDDHNADWGTLMGVQWETGKTSPTHVYGPNGTTSMRLGFLQYFEPNARLRMSDSKALRPFAEFVRAHDISEGGLVFEDDRVKVTAAEVCHFHFDAAATVAGSPAKSFAFRFQTPDKVIVFSGDTGRCPPLAEFARDADLLIHAVISLPLMADALRTMFAGLPGGGPPGLLDSVMTHVTQDHTSPEDIGKLATAARVKKVVLSHFAPGRDSDPESAYLDGVKKFYDGPVVAARDLMVFRD